MQVPLDIRPDDRVLILGIPAPEFLHALAASLPRGLLVAMADGDSVRDARKTAAQFSNVMCVPGTPDEIPWRDGFFTRVIDLVGNWPDPQRVQQEIDRVTTAPPDMSMGRP